MLDSIRFYRQLGVLSLALATLLIGGCGGGGGPTGGGTAGSQAPAGLASAPALPLAVQFGPALPVAVVAQGQDQSPGIPGIQADVQIAGLPPGTVVRLLRAAAGVTAASAAGVFVAEGPTDSAGTAMFHGVTLMERDKLIVENSAGKELATATVRVNNAPAVSAGENRAVQVGSSVQLQGVASDADQDTLFVQWSQLSGPSASIATPNAATLSFEASQVGEYLFRFTAVDSMGDRASADVRISVGPPLTQTNHDPKVTLAPSRTVVTNRVVTLTASASDPDGDRLSYAWRQTAGPIVTLTGESTLTVTFNPTSPGNYEFVIAANDGRGIIAQATVKVLVNAPPTPNHDPVASAGADRNEPAGSTVTLEGTASDVDGDTLTYFWTQTEGPVVTLSAAAALRPTFTPAVDGSYAFSLAVDDGNGGTASARVTVTVLSPPPPNRDPVVNAGTDRSGLTGEPFTLVGAATDPDNDPMTYAWTQLSGPIVTLAAGTTLFPAFTPALAGSYVFRLVADDGRGGITQSSVTMTIAAPPPGNRQPIANASAAQYGVGFGSTAILDGSGSFDPDADALAYSWTQSSSDKTTATLVGADTARPSFVTTGIEGGFSVAKMPIPTAYGVLALPAAAASAYNFTLTVRDPQGLTATNTVEIVSRFHSIGTTNSAIGVPIYLNVSAAASYNWVMDARPSGSGADLMNSATRFAFFVPDKQGLYTVHEGARAPFSIHAGKFVGMETNCKGCHQASGDPRLDHYDSFVLTPHANKMKYHLDGHRGQSYNATCYRCHSVGYDPTASAANDGFDDAVRSTGWTQPKTLAAGVYDALPDAVKAKANIQCESCHGPGSEHTGNKQRIAKSLDVEVCAKCHRSQPAEWYRSTKHKSPIQSPVTNKSCTGCHSGLGYIAVASQLATTDTVTLVGNYPSSGPSVLPTGNQPFTCAVCHDPHKTATPRNADGTKPETYDFQLRMFNKDMKLLGGKVITDTGMSATCIQCHHARRTPDTVDTATKTTRITAHYGVQADMLMGVNGYQVKGQKYSNSPHTVAVTDRCVACHMAEPDGKKTGDVNEAGGHTFRMIAQDGSSNAAVACAACHEGLMSYDRPASGGAKDYDGNGKAEGVQTEVKGLLSLIETEEIRQNSQAWTIFTTSEAASNMTTPQRGAAWNFKYVEDDGSFGVHNSAYAIQLLQKSYKHLTGSDVPHASIR